MTINGEKEDRYYASARITQVVDQELIQKMIAEETSIQLEDVEIAMKQLGNQIQRLLTLGFSVKIDNVGIFSPTIKSKFVPSFDDVHNDVITKVYTTFRPSGNMKKAMKKAGVKRTLEAKRKHM